MDPEESFNMSEVDSSANMTDRLHWTQFDYQDVPKTDLIIGIVFLVLGIPLQCFAVIYERFNMDPMKRGVVNQVSMQRVSLFCKLVFF